MTPREYARAWQKRATDYGPSMRRELIAIGNVAHSVADRLLTAEIYAKPEDKDAAGQPRWRRTNRLAASEQPPRFEESNGRLRVVLENTAVYAHRRHEANRPGFPFRVNPARTAHWRDDMLAITDQELTERIRRLNLAILRET